MYETMMGRTELEALPVEQQKQMLQGYRLHFYMKDILKHWKMSTIMLYTLIKNLEFPALPKEKNHVRKIEKQVNKRSKNKWKCYHQGGNFFFTSIIDSRTI